MFEEPAKDTRSFGVSRLLPFFLLSGALLLMAACEGGGVTGPPIDITPRLETVTVTSRDNVTEIPVNGTVELSATGKDQNGNTFSPGQVTWTSSDETRATVNQNGVVTGRGGGSVTITARGDNNKTGSITLTIRGAIHSQSITANETWRAADNPHLVTRSLTVDGSSTPVLTLEPGVEVRFARDAGLAFGGNSGGTLKAVGTQAAPIRMIADNASPQPGFWKGLLFQNGSGSSELRHATLSHCGGGNATGAACVFANSRPVVENVTVQQSGRYGVYLDDAGAFGSGSGNLTVRGSAHHPIHVEANQAGSIPVNTVLAENARNTVEIQGGSNQGTVSTSQTWPNLGVPYVISGPQLFVGGPGVATLTLLAGTELRFQSQAEVFIGINRDGALLVQGTAAAPVRFTADASAPVAGHWRGISLTGPAASASRLTHTVVEFCGGGPGTAKCLEIDDQAKPVIQDVTVRNSAAYGVVLNNFAAFGTGSARLSVSGSALRPVRIEGNSVGTLPVGSYTGNAVDAVEVVVGGGGGTVATTQTWPNPGVPYILDGPQFFVTGAGSPTLTLTPGTELRLSSGLDILVGRFGSGTGGLLIARGTAQAPIRFTAHAATPSPGHWRVMTFYAGSAGSRLENVVVEFGGEGQAPSNGSVHVLDPSIGPFITRTVIRNSASCGILVERNVPVDFTAASLNNTFTGNAGPAQCVRP